MSQPAAPPSAALAPSSESAAPTPQAERSSNEEDLLKEMTPVWVIQSFAEAEVARLHNFQPRKAQNLALQATLPLFDSLTQGEARIFPLLKDASADGSSEIRKPVALFWSPTPLSLAAARERRFHIGAQPTFECLQRVLSKRFLVEADLPSPPEGRIFESVEAVQAAHQILGNRLRIKKEFGHAGRGQRVMKAEFTQDDHRLIRDGLKSGVWIGEKNLDITLLLSIHALLLPTGELYLGQLCEHQVDRYDAPTSTLQLAARPDFPGAMVESLAKRAEGIAEQAADALRQAGYFGAFGADLILSHDELYLIDLNARFTLGWSEGMGNARAGALAAYLKATCSEPEQAERS